MRPERTVVKKAISDAGGNLRKASAILGCTRQTLYTWCYQLGLERFAGIRMDTRHELDTRERVDTRSGKEKKSGVYSRILGGPTLRAVEAQTVDVGEIPIQATVKVRESLWKRAKIEAIRRGCTLGELVERALEGALTDERAKAKGQTK